MLCIRSERLSTVRAWPVLRLTAWSLVSLLGLVACTPSRSYKIDQAATPRFKPQNFYHIGLPYYLKRVVVLPIYYSAEQGAFLETMDEVFASELTRNGLFEVVPLSRQTLAYHFKEPQLPATGVMPPGFIEILQENYQAQGALLIDLTYYKPYPPLALGLRAKLLNLRTQQLIWAFDCLLDAGSPSVAAAARHFEKYYNRKASAIHIHDLILKNPNAFSKYAAFSMFRTLRKPQR